MANITGEITTTVAGKEYVLRLTMRGLATLQDEYGQDLAPILSVKPGQMPHFGICLRLVELALKKRHPDATPDLADDILTEDPEIVGRIIQAAFPDADSKAAGKQRAAGE